MDENFGASRVPGNTIVLFPVILAGVSVDCDSPSINCSPGSANCLSASEILFCKSFEIVGILLFAFGLEYDGIFVLLFAIFVKECSVKGGSIPAFCELEVLLEIDSAVVKQLPLSLRGLF